MADEPIAAADALTDALTADIERLLNAEPEVRADADDSVHQMRVATRRLRSVLRSYRKLLDPDADNRMRTGTRLACRAVGCGARCRGPRRTFHRAARPLRRSRLGRLRNPPTTAWSAPNATGTPPHTARS
ncbi:CHAD domain-containing protein, partial [Nocardia testacea]|uniref:CHAD domain-containing protein n=1 Tax=Nocardia testacea TaxID=248551 RepID=UPI001FE11719